MAHRALGLSENAEGDGHCSKHLAVAASGFREGDAPAELPGPPPNVYRQWMLCSRPEEARQEPRTPRTPDDSLSTRAEGLPLAIADDAIQRVEKIFDANLFAVAPTSAAVADSNFLNSHLLPRYFGGNLRFKAEATSIC
jgi:hypothetical protein